MQTNKIIIALSLGFAVWGLAASAQQPTARTLFGRMAESLDTVRTISYNLAYRNVNNGQEDSVFWSLSKTWAKRVASDTNFGAHFHVRQQSSNGVADYYYDGIHGIDIYHRHAKKEALAKMVTIIEPHDLSNGDNAVQARTTARGFSEELLSPTLPKRWIAYLDSMEVTPTPGAWLIRWRHNLPADGFVADVEVALDKATHLISHIKQFSVWNGVAMTQTTNITSVQINQPEIADSIQLTQDFPGYTVKYVRSQRSASSGHNDAGLVGQPAKRFAYTPLGKSAVRLAAPKGGLLLLDFWETWCGYCFLAMPKLEALYAKYKDNGFAVVGVVTENKAQVEKMLTAKPLGYPTVFAQPSAVAAYRLSARPRYILINDGGMVVADNVANLEQVEQILIDRLKSRGRSQGITMQ